MNRYSKLKMHKPYPRIVCPNLPMGMPSQAPGGSPRNVTVNTLTTPPPTHTHTSPTIKQIDKEPRRSSYHPMNSNEQIFLFYKEKSQI